MSVFAIKMNFLDALHIGRGADELDKTATIYGSDALKSALFAIGLPYYSEWAENPQGFFEGFKISSAFPFCNGTYFLPKPPAMRFNFAGADDIGKAKKAKKISYVSLGLFEKWIQKPVERVSVNEEQVGDSSFLFEQGQKGRKFIYTTVQQRVSVSPDGSSDSKPFYFERMFFAENSGLYFLIEFLSEDLKHQLIHALQLLGDAGIGTDRTVGNGQFNAETPQPINLPNANKQNLQMALGLYLPTREEIAVIDLEKSAWGLIKRGGYMAAASEENHRSLRKNSIYFFAEGSAFKSTETLTGKIVNLRPKNFKDDTLHPIWRCGMPLFINL